MIEPEISDTRCYVVARIERREPRVATAADAAQHPWRYSTMELQCLRVLFTAAAARAARVLGEAGRGALPTAGKREGISF